MPPCGQAARRVSPRRVAAYVVTLSLAVLWGIDPTNSLASDNFGDVAVIEPSLIGDVPDGQAILLRLRELLATLGASLRTVALRKPIATAVRTITG